MKKYMKFLNIMGMVLGMVGIVAGVVGTVMAVYASRNPESTLKFILQYRINDITMNFAQWAAIWMPFGMAIIFFLIFIVLFFSGFKNILKKRHLAKVGIRTKAVVVSVQDTGVTVNLNPYVIMVVEIKLGIKATFRTVVSRVQIPRPGDIIEIIYDPANLNDIILA